MQDFLRVYLLEDLPSNASSAIPGAEENLPSFFESNPLSKFCGNSVLDGVACVLSWDFVFYQLIVTVFAIAALIPAVALYDCLCRPLCRCVREADQALQKQVTGAYSRHPLMANLLRIMLQNVPSTVSSTAELPAIFR